MSFRLPFAALAVALSTAPALAQRTDDNATAQAEDAFGKSVGDEQIGIYNQFDVRGFSPVIAGNLRIEGLYFDQQSNVTARLIEGSAVKVGISAQGYPFPAPTGIADYSLRKPGEEFVGSFGVQVGPWYGKLAEFDLQIPIDGARLGLTAGAGVYREGTTFQARPNVESYGASLRWAPSDNVSIQPFWSHISVRDEEGEPLIFVSGDFLPPRIRRDRFFGQRWGDFSGNLGNYGMVARGRAGGFDIGFGAFRSYNIARKDSVDLLFDTDREGNVGRRLVVLDRDNKFASTSGELRASRPFAEGPRRHTLHASLRARKLDRRFGGSDVIDLGPSRAGVQDFRPEPTPVIGPKKRDRVEQKTASLGYELRWRDVGELSLGVQKTDYSKRVTDPDPAVIIPESKDSPWLFSATAAVYIAEGLAIYGGYTRGLEESDVAPGNAINRNEAPPAIRTEQKDAGIRWTISPGLTAVVGYFDVEKPYFNLDAASRYRELGMVRHHGVELSLAGQPFPNFTVVGGTILLDADVTGEQVEQGLIGKNPVGTMKRRNLVSVNYNLPFHEPLTLTGRFESTSDRVANVANTLVVPARSVFGMGARYRLKVGGVQALVRATVDNIFNKFGFGVGGSGFFVVNGSRRYSLALSADI